MPQFGCWHYALVSDDYGQRDSHKLQVANCNFGLRLEAADRVCSCLKFICSEAIRRTDTLWVLARNKLRAHNVRLGETRRQDNVLQSFIAKLNAAVWLL